ncbi:hypothetical protein CW752_14880 [Chryseobacterium sp. PMSZPI]|nr:hypothetical protein CW752_14880 [Chryseobacterium sp. PMSZPI]
MQDLILNFKKDKSWKKEDESYYLLAKPQNYLILIFSKKYNRVDFSAETSTTSYFQLFIFVRFYIIYHYP